MVLWLGPSASVTLYMCFWFFLHMKCFSFSFFTSPFSLFSSMSSCRLSFSSKISPLINFIPCWKPVFCFNVVFFHILNKHPLLSNCLLPKFYEFLCVLDVYCSFPCEQNFILKSNMLGPRSPIVDMWHQVPHLIFNFSYQNDIKFSKTLLILFLIMSFCIQEMYTLFSCSTGSHKSCKC